MASAKNREWWKHCIVYQIYPRSFQDSNGDGIGDLKGIESRLDYLQYLGVGAIWLSPIYKSPMADFGYDVADHKAIDRIFGTMGDFDDLLKAVHDRGMYLIMDFIPNHTSDLHQWFVESRKGGKNNPYADFYRWSPGKMAKDGTRSPPNNWLSIFGGSAWEWDEGRREYYLHQFVKEQPDLDYRNPKVVEEMKDVLRFWTKKGVDGFRVDAIATLFEVEDLSLDEPRSHKPGATPNQHEYLLHPHTIELPEIHGVVKGWRSVLDEIDKLSGRHTFMVMEVYDPEYSAMKYYHSGADMPFNFDLVLVDETYNGMQIRNRIQGWFQHMPQGKWANFVIGNHDRSRITSRRSPEQANAFNMLLLTLPGTPTTYYGEEIAINGIEVSYEDTQDPYGVNMGPEIYKEFSRDPSRAPMQWSSGKNAGFSDAEKTWLPVHPDYVTRNVEEQNKFDKSPLQIYRRLAELRKNKAFRNSELQFNVVSEDIVSYVRSQEEEAYLVALNIGKKPSTDTYRVVINGDVIRKGHVVVNTGNVDSSLALGAVLDLGSITLTPGDGVVLKLSRNL